MSWYSEYRNEWKEIIEAVARECKRAELMVEKDTVQSMFIMNVQSLERTFIDKIFAICDYRIQNMEEKKELLNQDERVVEIELERLRGFVNHPFKVQADSQMIELQESIKKYGILNPLIVRPRQDGTYEIISGHRRKFAAEKIGYRKVPVIIRVLKDDEAVVSMVDSNLQREMISPSEKAFAYKMKYEAIKRKAGRRKCGQVDHNLGKKSIELIGEECGDSPKQVQRYIKITELIPEMLEKGIRGQCGGWKHLFL